MRHRDSINSCALLSIPLENQLYRVENSRERGAGLRSRTALLPHAPGTATFKWSRDNASVSISVSSIASVTNSLGNPASQLIVTSLGRDHSAGRFTPGNWFEITDVVELYLQQPASGYYQLTSKFAELTWTAAGIRLFNVSVNGQQVLTNFDVFQQAGGQNIAFDHIFSNVAPTSQGQIVVRFSGVNTAMDPEATISVIEIDPQWTGTPSLSQENAFQTFFDELAQLGEQGFAALAVWPLQMRLTDNEMQGLSGTVC